MRNALITGSKGFIGTYLKAELIKDGWEIFEMNSDSDITDQKNFLQFENQQINHVFHLAAKTFVPDSWQNPLSFYHTNVMGTTNVVEFCRKKAIPLTYVSAYLYGVPQRVPISEDDQVMPNNPYALSKQLAEKVCNFYAKEYGVRITIFRPFNVYGIGQTSHFLIPSLIRQAIYSPEIMVKDLMPKRDYVYIEDLIDALMLSIDKTSVFNVYNIGSGYSVSVNGVIEIILNLLGTEKKVITENVIRKNEIHDVIANISKANKELGWYPKYSIKHGLEKLIMHERERLNE